MAGEGEVSKLRCPGVGPVLLLASLARAAPGAAPTVQGPGLARGGSEKHCVWGGGAREAAVLDLGPRSQPPGPESEGSLGWGL